MKAKLSGKLSGELLRTTGLVVAVLAGMSWAVAQQPPSAPEAQQPTAQPSAALVNGALAVPGAPADTDTIPAKFSQRNAADDNLIIVAYTFKNLGPEQRRAIYAALKGQPSASGVDADIGTELPLAIELRPVPQEVTAHVPQTNGYQYVMANNRVLLVSPPTRFVVGVFSEAD